jgi:DNA mismatch repair ATPase MutS
LGIKLTSKPTKNGRQAFAGFPLAQLGKQVSLLVQAGHKVVIVEEFKEIGSSKVKTSRRVSRIVTPGTGVDEAFVALDQSNFVLALALVDGSSLKNEIGLAYRDISTGASFTRTSKLSALRDDIRLVQPKEVVVDTRLRGSKLGDRILELLEGERVREGIMVSKVSTDAVPSTSKDVPTVAANAEAVLLSYLATTLVSTPVPSASTTHIDDASVMHMDAVTLQSLEIRESLRGGVRGSLLGTVKRTVTPGGQRLLTERLCEYSALSLSTRARELMVSLLRRQPLNGSLDHQRSP